MKYSTIVITDKNFGISINNKIPWKSFDLYNKYMDFFKKEKILLMGKNTYTRKIHYLKNCNYEVLSKKKNIINIEKNINKKKFVNNNLKINCSTDYVVVGGGQTYKYYNDPEEIYLFKLDKDYKCDKFFDKISSNYYLVEIKYFVKENTKNNDNFTFYKYVKKINDKDKSVRDEDINNITGEVDYLNLCNKVYNFGKEINDRTGTGVVSVFGSNNISFNLKYGVPLLTTKKMAWKSIIAELIWFLRGSTNLNELKELGCKVWDANADENIKKDIPFLKDSYKEDCGAIYGFQWRHFGAKYINCHTDYKGKGFDQIKYIIEEIKKNPSSRRLILSAWNPVDLDKTILPPCHMTAQFNVSEGKLNCQVYQRSADIFLGVPFNIFSYAVLLHIIAIKCDLSVGMLHFSFGDAHIYKNHFSQIKEQIKRETYAFPHLTMYKVKDSSFKNITVENFNLVGYNSHSKITGSMSV